MHLKTDTFNRYSTLSQTEFVFHDIRTMSHFAAHLICQERQMLEKFKSILKGMFRYFVDDSVVSKQLDR